MVATAADGLAPGLHGDLAAAGLDSIDAEVAFLDGRGRILAVNRAWRRFADRNDAPDPDAYVGRSYIGSINPEEGATARRAAEGVRRVLEGKEDAWRMEYPCPGPDGEERWFILRVTRFQGPGPVRAVVVHDDITARKLQERTASRLHRERMRTQRAQQAERSWVAVLNLLAHQINTPMTPMMLDLGILLERLAEDPDAQQNLARLKRNLERLQETAGEATRILALQAKESLPLEEADWAKEVQAAVEDVAEEHGFDGVEVVAGDGAEGARVSLHRGRLRDLLEALLRNAATHNRKGGQVRVRVGVKEGLAHLEVQDDGRGVSATDARRIDALFKDGMHSLASQEVAGLGLLQATLIARLHRGALERVPGEGGLCIRLQIPTVSSSPAPGSRRSRRSAQRRPGRTGTAATSSPG